MPLCVPGGGVCLSWLLSLSLCVCMFHVPSVPLDELRNLAQGIRSRSVSLLSYMCGAWLSVRVYLLLLLSVFLYDWGPGVHGRGGAWPTRRGSERSRLHETNAKHASIKQLSEGEREETRAGSVPCRKGVRTTHMYSHFPLSIRTHDSGRRPGAQCSRGARPQRG